MKHKGRHTSVSDENGTAELNEQNRNSQFQNNEQASGTEDFYQQRQNGNQGADQQGNGDEQSERGWQQNENGQGAEQQYKRSQGRYDQVESDFKKTE